MQRYFTSLDLSARTAHERLTRICFIDYDRQLALVAEKKDSDTGPVIVGVSRMIHNEDGTSGILAIVVADDYQGQGLGEELTRRALKAARAEAIERVLIHFLPENARMRALSQKLGFTLTDEKDLVRGELSL